MAWKLERARRFERPTLTLARLCSTPELRPRSVKGVGYGLKRRTMQYARVAKRGNWAHAMDSRNSLLGLGRTCSRGAAAKRGAAGVDHRLWRRGDGAVRLA